MEKTSKKKKPVGLIITIISVVVAYVSGVFVANYNNNAALAVAKNQGADGTIALKQIWFSWIGWFTPTTSVKLTKGVPA